MKKLKIQFWKAEKGLVMQILEQEGLPKKKRDGYVRIYDSPALISGKVVWLRGYLHYANLRLKPLHFATNAERDEYLQKAVNAITDELFTGEDKLKVGEMCEVRDAKSACWNRRRLIAILPEKHYFRYITECAFDDRDFNYWKYARPITKRTEPKVEECGQLITYTWEEKWS